MEPHETHTPARDMQHDLLHFGLHLSSSSALEHDDVVGVDCLSELDEVLQHEHEEVVCDIDESIPLVDVPLHSVQSQLAEEDPLIQVEQSESVRHVVFFDSANDFDPGAHGFL